MGGLDGYYWDGALDVVKGERGKYPRPEIEKRQQCTKARQDSKTRKVRDDKRYTDMSVHSTFSSVAAGEIVR